MIFRMSVSDNDFDELSKFSEWMAKSDFDIRTEPFLGGWQLGHVEMRYIPKYHGKELSRFMYDGKKSPDDITFDDFINHQKWHIKKMYERKDDEVKSKFNLAFHQAYAEFFIRLVEIFDKNSYDEKLTKGAKNRICDMLQKLFIIFLDEFYKDCPDYYKEANVDTEDIKKYLLDNFSCSVRTAYHSKNEDGSQVYYFFYHRVFIRQ